MNTMKVSIPHQLSREEARQRIQGQLGQLRQQSAGLIGSFEERWSGDAMDFSAAVMGTPICGKLQVEDRAVHVEVELPWFLAALARPVTQALESNTRNLLEHRTPAAR